MQTGNANRNEAKRRYYQENRERIREQKKADYQKHRESQRQKARTKYHENREQELARHKKWREANPDVYRDSLRNSQLWNKYGITLEDYEKLFDSQGRSCAICKIEEASWCVDHCHDSGEVRGILCTHCNTGLGMFRDQTSFMENAITYLNRKRQPKRS